MSSLAGMAAVVLRLRALLVRAEKMLMVARPPLERGTVVFHPCGGSFQPATVGVGRAPVPDGMLFAMSSGVTGTWGGGRRYRRPEGRSSSLDDVAVDKLNAKGTVLRMARSRSDEELLALQRRGLELLRSPETRGSFIAIDVASSLNILSKRPTRLRVSAFIDEVQVRGVDVTGAMDAKGVPICLNALSKFETVNSVFIDVLQRRGVEVVDTMNEQGVANCLNALGKVEGVDTDFVRLLQRRGVEVVATMNAQDVANCLNALVKIEGVDMDFVDVLQRRGVEVIDEMDEQGVANCLNALAKIESIDMDFVGELQRRGVEVVDEMDEQNVANCLNAVCHPDRLHLVDMSFVRLLQGRVGVVNAMIAQQVSMSLYALQWIEDADRAFVHELQQRGLAVVAEMNSLDITNCLFAMSKMSKFDSSWQDAAFMEMLQLCVLESDIEAEMDPKMIAKCLYALSRLDPANVRDDAVLRLKSRADEVFEDMDEHSKIMTRGALERLGRGEDP